MSNPRDPHAPISPIELIKVKQAAREINQDVFMAKELEPYCEYSAKQIGRRLSKLEDGNVVERANAQTPHRWRILK